MVVALIGFFWLLFAIVGVQSFKASMARNCIFDGAAAFPPTDNYTQNYLGGNGNMQYCGGWWKAVPVVLVTKGCDRRGLPKDRRSKCLEIGFIRESGSL